MRRAKNVIDGNNFLSFNITIKKHILNCFDGQDGQNDSSSSDIFGAKKAASNETQSLFVDCQQMSREMRIDWGAVRFVFSIRYGYDSSGLKIAAPSIVRESTVSRVSLDCVGESFVCGFKCIH